MDVIRELAWQVGTAYRLVRDPWGEPGHAQRTGGSSLHRQSFVDRWFPGRPSWGSLPMSTWGALAVWAGEGPGGRIAARSISLTSQTWRNGALSTAMGFPIGIAMGRHTGQGSEANLAKSSLAARATSGSASGNVRFVDGHRRSPVTSQSRAP